MHSAFDVTEMFLGQHYKSQAVSFCLTRRNMPFREFHNAVVGMLQAFDILAELRLHFALGTYRHLEVTHHGDDYHPHLHCLMIVEPWYWSPASRVYMRPEQLTRAWRVALGVDYDTVTKFTGIRTLGNLAAWFRYLDQDCPVHLADIQIAKFGSGLAELERRLMSQEEDTAYGRGTDFRGQLSRHQSNGQGGRRRQELATQSDPMASVDD